LGVLVQVKCSGFRVVGKKLTLKEMELDLRVLGAGRKFLGRSV
jgi:hypothetical protein